MTTGRSSLFLASLTAVVISGGCRTTDGTDSEVKFYGADNQSADMRYDSYIEVKLPAGVTTDNQLLQEPQRSRMRSVIELQIQHMFGAFTEHPEYVKNPGIIQGRNEPQISSAQINRTAGTARINYSYTDKVVFKKRLMAGGPTKIKFVLPRDPQTIYQKGIPAGSSENKCTDEHYNTEGDFWYFWNPKKPGCPLKKDDLVEVTADLTPIPNTKSTYPYYAQLLGDNGNGRTVKVVYLVGIDENFRAGDLGRQTFNEAFSLLKQEGFKAGPGGTARKKNLTLKKPDFDVELTLTLVDPGSDAFVRAAADGLETADVFIYDGHSGLGGYLEIDRFVQTLGRSLKLPVSKNQIFYFNGCSTFAYYNADYFALKKTAQDPDGRTNLDVITTSIGATFDIGARHDVALIGGLFGGKKPSWQNIMDQIYKVDRTQTALTHVNGDEDNPTSPQ
jgi:hypothetical protein